MFLNELSSTIIIITVEKYGADYNTIQTTTVQFYI